MAAEDVIAEAVARIEHKLDLLLEMVGRIAGPGNTGFILTPVGDQRHVCPVCTQQVQYLVDIMKKVVTRKCSCATGKFAPVDISLFAPPLAKETRNGEGRRVQEDGIDTDAGGGRSHSRR